jgi:CheY-like chemotaxis protein
MSCRIVIAEDSADDLFLFLRAMRRASASTSLHLVATLENGEEVLEYLTGQGRYADRQKFPLPDLLVLDVKMPRMSGLEVLEWLQTQNFPGMKVVVLTGSFLPDDIEASKRLGADAVFTKPLDQSELVEIVESVLRQC